MRLALVSRVARVGLEPKPIQTSPSTVAMLEAAETAILRLANRPESLPKHVPAKLMQQ